MPDLITLEFSNVSVVLVGTENSIKGVKAYCDFCEMKRQPISFEILVERIINSKVYARFEGKP